MASYVQPDYEVVGGFVAGYLLDVPPGEARFESVLDVAPDLAALFRFGRMLPLDERMPHAVLTSHPPDAGILGPYAAATGKVLYLTHDPRSLLSEVLLISGKEGDERTRLARKLISLIGRPGERGKDWPAHVREWTTPDRVRARFPGLGDIRVVRIEDLHADPAGVLRQILEFLDLPEPLDEARIERAARDWAPAKVDASKLLKLPPGISEFRDEPERDPIPEVLPSLLEIGEEIEAAYQEQLRDNPEFAEFLRRFGYET
ncbi:hypothetical protein ACQP2X_34620 [Actinoplanes sp. CA-131856]